MPKTQPILAIIIPCYNEQKALSLTIEQLLNILKNLSQNQKISPSSFIYLVDDGSQDKTWSLISNFHHKSPKKIKGLKLSRNFGQQYAILAGLLQSKNRADLFLTIDADLQDDHKAIPKFIDAYCGGNEIIYGVRKQRKNDTYFKKTSASLFYKLMHALGVDVIKDHADYRLVTKKVLNELANFSEANLFLRGIFPLIGFKNKIIYYNRSSRNGGRSKYSLKKMLSLALDGITSMSIKPLRFVSWIGFLIFLFSLIMIIWVLIDKYLIGNAIAGWASTVLPIYLIGGIQILSIGIIGEYLGKIYKEVKHRPRFIIEEEL